MVDGLLLRHFCPDARGASGLQVLRRFNRVFVLGTFLLDVFLRMSVREGGGNEGGLALVNGGDGLVSVAIGRRFYFRHLQDSVFTIQYFRRIFSAFHRRGLSVLGMAYVPHIRPTIKIGDNDDNFHFLVVSFHSHLAAGRCFVIFTCLRFGSQRCSARQASIVTRQRHAECDDHEFHRTMSGRRVSTCQVGGFVSLVKGNDANDQRGISVLGTSHLLRWEVSHFFMRLVFRLVRRQEYFPSTRVVRVVSSARFSDVRRRHLLWANYLVSLLLCTYVCLFPRAKGATRRHQPSLLSDHLGVYQAGVSAGLRTFVGAGMAPHFLRCIHR